MNFLWHIGIHSDGIVLDQWWLWEDLEILPVGQSIILSIVIIIVIICLTIIIVIVIIIVGDLSFWYRDTEARCMKLVADWREPCTVMCGWSPDGRHFYTASTFPRMKVDNHFKVFDYEGNLLVAKSYPQLLDFQWKPEPSRKYDSPIPPTPQNSAIAAAKKFKTAKDLVCDVKDARRFGAGRGRKDVVTQNPVAPTTAQVAKLERNRQLDSISDWRAGEFKALFHYY